ncbi:MFS transporter [Eilatimonas milleporae]|uniref:Putative MFS family arabinose efflux permease n=1 Tax=Eilatimonas milleporae TaxID=911205 RepID=A0A3M0CF73_9PROT|nr:MFS transporter [Eilatimonas milleporae]RMB08062.1 putative MFS family arabinose efflux permease [Eilatimonas milleporae]
MFRILSNRTYRHLFAAQVIALVGTGLATVALGLLAWDLAGGDAGQVLGTALAIKMVAYVTLSPVAQAFADRIPRRSLLVALNLIRAAVAAALPFVTDVWQVYGLIFLLQAASAGFTPAFQATIPDILTDEEDYTRALSLSRLAYDLESLLSPMLAAALLTVVSFPVLFGGTVIGFVASALLVLSVALPWPKPAARRGVWTRITRGSRIYLATPRLRALLALSVSVAAASAMVIVNTVVLVRRDLGLPDEALALTLAAFGAGSMVAALGLPHLLERLSERRVMLAGAAGMTLALAALGTASALWDLRWGWLLTAWFLIGTGYSATVTPSGRLLRRSGHGEDRPALFAAQFALSHACWLVTYPLAGWLQAAHGSAAAMLVLAGLALMGLGAAGTLWPRRDPAALPHVHDDLPADHPHIAAGRRHSHAYVIDDLHPRWPGNGKRARGL